MSYLVFRIRYFLDSLEWSMQETIFVLFGATGDLARLKVLPALRKLWEDKQLAPNFRLIAIGRRDFSTTEYVNYLAHLESDAFSADLSPLNLEYLCLDFEQQNGFNPLWKLLEEHQRGKHYFYMSLGPDVLNLSLSQFEQAVEDVHWLAGESAILVEKPFGEDGKTATTLNSRLIKLFGNNVYRHDHYLAKDSIEAIVKIRQHDAAISKVLNHQYLKQIKLIISEKVDIGSRAGYFDGRGMLVDWFQSHMLQILASVCAQPEFTKWHQAKAQFVNSLKLVPDSILRAQYDGYQEVSGIRPDSDTETFLALKLKSSVPRWQETEFALVTGKGMAAKEVAIKFEFKQPHPNFGAELVWSFDPPAGHALLKKLSGDEFSQTIQEFIQGESANFVTMPEIVAQWKITDSIKPELSKTELAHYPKGLPYHHFCTDKWCEVDF